MVEQANGGFTITISGDSAILTQRLDGEVVPVYHEASEGGRTSVGDMDSQLLLGRELAKQHGSSLGIIYSDRIKEVSAAREELARDPDGELMMSILNTFANPDQIPSF